MKIKTTIIFSEHFDMYVYEVYYKKQVFGFQSTNKQDKRKIRRMVRNRFKKKAFLLEITVGGLYNTFQPDNVNITRRSHHMNQTVDIPIICNNQHFHFITGKNNDR